MRSCRQPDQIFDRIKYNCTISYRNISNLLLQISIKTFSSSLLATCSCILLHLKFESLFLMFIPRLTYCKIKHFLFYALRKGKNDKPLAFFFFSPFFKVTVLLTHVSSFCFVLLANSFLSILFLHVIFSEKGCHFFPLFGMFLKSSAKTTPAEAFHFADQMKILIFLKKILSYNFSTYWEKKKNHIASFYSALTQFSVCHAGSWKQHY